MSYSNNHYRKYLQPYANKLRKDMTKAEACLWKYALRAKKLKGYSFRRQRPVLKYIADFMCLELKLVIEVDGRTHLEEATIAKDEIKQTDLEKAGYTVLRFTDGEVLKHITTVISCIEDWIVKKENETDPEPGPGPGHKSNNLPE